MCIYHKKDPIYSVLMDFENQDYADSDIVFRCKILFSARFPYDRGYPKAHMQNAAKISIEECCSRKTVEMQIRMVLIKKKIRHPFV